MAPVYVERIKQHGGWATAVVKRGRGLVVGGHVGGAVGTVGRFRGGSGGSVVEVRAKWRRERGGGARVDEGICARRRRRTET